MAAFPTSPTHALRFEPGPPKLLRSAIDPLIAVGLLAATVAFEGESFGAPYLILTLLVFSMMYPGGLARFSVGAGALAGEILTGWGAMVTLLLMLGWATGTLGLFDMRVLTLWVLSTPLVLFAAHRMVPALLPRMFAAEGLHRTAVIAGANELGRRLAERISSDPFLGVRCVGYFDDRCESRREGLPEDQCLGSLDEIADHVKAHRVDIIYITLPMAAHPRVVTLLEALRDTTASIYFVPDILLFDLIHARMDTIGGMPVLAVCESPFYGVNGLVKRASDLVLTSLILLLISPLMVALAIGVKLSSPGPVIFRQRRYGADGREIVVYKYRSMRVTEDGPVVKQATREDPRVTRFGRFIRKTSLDELPQFINVLQGRMSIVGPRPHAVAHNEQYRKVIRGYMLRHKVKPGITGLAQVNGFRGETAQVEQMRGRIEQDLVYLRNWTLLLDLRIIAKTVMVVWGKQDVY
jgi:putative colanic acid biosynthesis UDP-glucose lipid carrier transferase